MLVDAGGHICSVCRMYDEEREDPLHHCRAGSESFESIGGAQRGQVDPAGQGLSAGVDHR